MKAQIREYYQVHKSVFEENFQLVIEDFDKEAIHKMRTTTKRLRDLFQLIGFLAKNKFNAKKQLRKIRNIFKFAGRIRELQIEEQLVIDYEQFLGKSFSDYREYLRAREFREISRFLKQLPAFSKRDKILNDKKILAAIDSIPEENVEIQCRKFAEDKVVKIQSILSYPTSNHRIHVVRTLLKQIYYLGDLAKLKPWVEEILGLTIEQIREMEQYLGTWHDLVNSPVFMNSFRKRKNFRHVAKYEILHKQILHDRKQMRKTILQEYFTELP